MPNYEEMSLEQLDKKHLELREKRFEIKAEQVELNAVREKRVDEKKVKEKIDGMTDKEKAIAAQVLGAKAIVSEEAVGEPGTK